MKLVDITKENETDLVSNKNMSASIETDPMIISYQGSIFTLREELISISTQLKAEIVPVGRNPPSSPSHWLQSSKSYVTFLLWVWSAQVITSCISLLFRPRWRPQSLTTVKIKTRPSHEEIVNFTQKKSLIQNMNWWYLHFLRAESWRTKETSIKSVTRKEGAQ